MDAWCDISVFFYPAEGNGVCGSIQSRMHESCVGTNVSSVNEGESLMGGITNPWATVVMGRLSDGKVNCGCTHVGSCRVAK